MKSALLKSCLALAFLGLSGLATADTTYVFRQMVNGSGVNCPVGDTAPGCTNYQQVCDQQLPGAENGSQVCTCGFADVLQQTQPVCAPVPAGAQPPAESAACPEAGWYTGNDPLCTGGNTGTLAQAQLIAPTSDAFNGYLDGNALFAYQTKIDNPTGQPKVVYWTAQGDNQSWYSLNGVQVGYIYNNVNWSIPTFTITLNPGVNTLTATVFNDPLSGTAPEYGPNPAMTIDQVTGPNGTVYSATGGNSWYQVPVPAIAFSPGIPSPEVNCYTQSCVATSNGGY